MSKCLSLALLLAGVAFPAAAGPFGLGRPALPDEIAAWNREVMPDGRGLPEGSGSAATGEELFAERCAACHGDFAEGLGGMPALAGGMGTLDKDRPKKTVGSYWPYLTTAWDYIDRSMPYGDARTLTPDQVYAVLAYILYSNDLVADDFVLSRENLLEVEMPNRDGFLPDDRPETEYPEFSEEPCMAGCKKRVEITKRVAVRDVIPK